MMVICFPFSAALMVTGLILDVIHTKLVLYFYKWCVANPERWYGFLQIEKGIPMTAILP